jgi:methylmalonyl-CoA mutase N-terminal domain/subunit
MATTDRRETESGIEIAAVYTADNTERELELPGEFPFTRGPYRDMYRGRPWTIRQYAGFASAEETNARFRYLLERGQTGLSVAPASQSTPSSTWSCFSTASRSGRSRRR